MIGRRFFFSFLQSGYKTIGLLYSNVGLLLLIGLLLHDTLLSGTGIWDGLSFSVSTPLSPSHFLEM